MDICGKHVWITSKVPAHALAKHFSPINRTACKSVDAPPAHTPPQIPGLPLICSLPNIMVRKHASNPRAAKKNNVILFRLGGQRKTTTKNSTLKQKLCLRPHLEFSGCDEKCGHFTSIFRLTNYFAVFTDIASATEELYTTTK